MMIKKPAFGLVEVLIGLAVFGTLIIAATSITIRSYRIVKDNEIADFANGIMIASLEKAKSDATIGVGGATSKSYLMKGEVVEVDGEITFNLDHIDYTGPAEYKIVDVDCEGFLDNERIDTSAINQLTVCNQIIVENQSENFLVTSRVVYKTATRWNITEASGYKINVY